jgi:hypothetical protein
MVRTGRPATYEKVTRTCEVCGTSWQQYPYENSKIRFCSRGCWAESRRGEKRGPYKARDIKSCETCSKTFEAGGTGQPSRRARFCSISCAAKARGNHVEARQMPELETAWLSGIFDGEGNIAWPRRHRISSIRLSITNTNMELLDKVVEVSGTGKLTTKVTRSIKHNQAWVWNCYGENSRVLLRQMLPWLIVKRDAAKAALGLVEANTAPETLRSQAMRRTS